MRPPTKHLTKKLKRPLKSETGQMSIMIAVMMTTFILFFAFVINVGMLVNAKINLQNAADMAAYAGASVQARQLTQISYLNYEMRRQWKKFLFRIYVLGNMSEDTFPRSVQGSAATKTPMQYSQTDVTTSPPVVTNYGVPITCMIFSTGDNYCRMTKLPKISMPPESPMDGINSALRTQLQAIEQIRETNCSGIAFTNKMLNYYWLYNADPTLANATQTIGSTPGLTQNVTKLLVGLIDGLGIVPREIILRFRISTLNGYVNTPAQSTLGFDKVQGLMTSQDPAAYERTIQAYLSAFYTLGNHTFPSGSIVMDEIQNNNLLRLNDLKETFDTYAIDMQLSSPDGNNSKDCVATIVPLSITQPLTLGVAKDPTVLTYYAVRLRAQARILFSPFGDLDLKAYSAAQPFGSRIGPPAAHFTADGQVNSSGGISTAVGKYPNLPLRADDSNAHSNGWDTQEVLGSMYGNLISDPSAPGSIAPITSDVIHQAYANAMAPNPWEVNQYNIINDTGQDSFIKNFGQDGLAAFWAPIFPPDQVATMSQDIQTAVQNLFIAPGGADQGIFTDLEASIATALGLYISSTLSQPQGGENKESRSVATLTSPFQVPNPAQTPQSVSGSPDLIVNGNDPLQFKTSWNGITTNSSLLTEGRVGYSVKFVSFDSLTKNRVTTNGQVMPNNGLGGDRESQGDIPYLGH